MALDVRHQGVDLPDYEFALALKTRSWNGDAILVFVDDDDELDLAANVNAHLTELGYDHVMFVTLTNHAKTCNYLMAGGVVACVGSSFGWSSEYEQGLDAAEYHANTAPGQARLQARQLKRLRMELATAHYVGVAAQKGIGVLVVDNDVALLADPFDFVDTARRRVSGLGGDDPISAAFIASPDVCPRWEMGSNEGASDTTQCCPRPGDELAEANRWPCLDGGMLFMDARLGGGIGGIRSNGAAMNLIKAWEERAQENLRDMLREVMQPVVALGMVRGGVAAASWGWGRGAFEVVVREAMQSAEGHAFVPAWADAGGDAEFTAHPRRLARPNATIEAPIGKHGENIRYAEGIAVLSPRRISTLQGGEAEWRARRLHGAAFDALAVARPGSAGGAKGHPSASPALGKRFILRAHGWYEARAGASSSHTQLSSRLQLGSSPLAGEKLLGNTRALALAGADGTRGRGHANITRAASPQWRAQVHRLLAIAAVAKRSLVPPTVDCGGLRSRGFQPSDVVMAGRLEPFACYFNTGNLLDKEAVARCGANAEIVHPAALRAPNFEDADEWSTAERYASEAERRAREKQKDVDAKERAEREEREAEEIRKEREIKTKDTHVKSAPKKLKKKKGESSRIPHGPNPERGLRRGLLAKMGETAASTGRLFSSRKHQKHAAHADAPVVDLSTIAIVPENRTQFEEWDQSAGTPADVLTLDAEEWMDPDYFVDAADIRALFDAVEHENGDAKGEAVPLVYATLGSMRAVPRVTNLSVIERERLEKLFGRCPI